MVDEGGRRRGDHSGGEDRPEQPERAVGGSDWLLQQLSGGRLKSIFDAPRTPAPAQADETRAEQDPAGGSAPDASPTARPDSEPSDATAPAEESADAPPASGASGPRDARTAPDAPATPLTPARREPPVARRAPDEESGSPRRTAPDAPALPPAADQPRLIPARRLVVPPATALPAAPAAPSTDAPRAAQPLGDRPDGATPPTPRESAPSGAVYHWPDPRGGWDEPPVWEEVVASRDEPEEDGGDEELWRGTAGAFAWNLEPTSDDESEPLDDDPRPAASPEKGDEPENRESSAPGAPFSTASASAHVNAPKARDTPVSKAKALFAARSASATAPAGRPTADRPTVARPPVEPPTASRSSKEPPRRSTGRRRLLIGLIAAGIVVVLAVILAIGFAIGSANSPAEPEAAPAPSASETPATVETPAPELPTVGPLPAGTWAWNTLLGGECLEPFDSVWAEEFSVVDCATTHTGEMVATGELTDATFPGQEALAVSVASVCQAEGVVDVIGAEAYGDVQVSGSFPVAQEQWDAGERSYYCFVDRAGGGELLGSLVGTPAA